MASNSSSSWRMLLPAMIVIALAAAWSVYWLVLSGKAQDLYRVESARLAHQSIALACARQDWGGYPFRIEMSCAEPVYEATGHGPLTRLEAKSLLVVMQAYDFRRIAGLIDGPTIVTLGAQLPPIRIDHGRALAAFHRLGGTENRLSVEIPLVAIDGFMRATTVSLHMRSRDDAVLDLAASANGAEITGHLAAALVIDEAAIEANLPLAAARDPDPLRAAARTGAKLDIARFSLVSGKLAISGSGSVSLTPAGLLDGKVVTAVSDVNLLLDTIEKPFAIGKTDIEIIRSIASGGKALSADLLIKDGIVYWGPIRLGEIAPFF